MVIAPRSRGEREPLLTEGGEPLLAVGELRDWAGRPGDAPNRGAWIEVGTPLGSIADPARREAWALLEQFDVGVVRVGQTAVLRSHAEPGRTWHGRVVEIAALPATAVSPEWMELDPTKLRERREDELRRRCAADDVVLCANRAERTLRRSSAVVQKRRQRADHDRAAFARRSRLGVVHTNVRVVVVSLKTKRRTNIRRS
ncbi:MAG: HlyD family secretion protein [Pirellulales bacterium]